MYLYVKHTLAFVTTPFADLSMKPVPSK